LMDACCTLRLSVEGALAHRCSPPSGELTPQTSAVYGLAPSSTLLGVQRL
jgi:hypothetical protein